MSIHIESGKVINPHSLEINVTLHCNMRCKSCAHLSPLFRREYIDATETHATLAVLAKNYHASYVKIIGGEPLLHPNIVEVISAVRASGVSDAIQVVTNGTLLARAPDR